MFHRHFTEANMREVEEAKEVACCRINNLLVYNNDWGFLRDSQCTHILGWSSPYIIGNSGWAGRVQQQSSKIVC